jgi:hypothetical protein
VIPETLTGEQEQCLRDPVITDEQPGPVLHDFQMLLDFVGPDGAEAAGKYNLIAIKHIDELDGRLSRPLHLQLKRPQIRSHPYLQGLNLLLLECIEPPEAKGKGKGKKTKLPRVLESHGKAPRQYPDWDE